MKALYKIFFAILLFFNYHSVFSQATMTNTITNFVITKGVKFSFDIYTLRTSVPAFRMGNSSYLIKFSVPGTLDNPVLSNINSKYTFGSVSDSYDSMETRFYHVLDDTDRVAVQVHYNGNNGGVGDVISNVPGTFGLGERIATVTLDILQPVPNTAQWDIVNSAVVSPSFATAISTWVGFFNGTLPVEMSTFTSSVNKNNAMLNWSTANELNNSGFEIERKTVLENSTWAKVGFVNGIGTSNEIQSYSFEDKGLEAGKYNYRLKQIDFNGNHEYFHLDNEIVIGVPDKFELSQNYPNPFNPTTNIKFSLPNDTKVSLNIYDVSGRLVMTLLNNEFKTANYYTVQFNASNLSSGTYFYSITTDRYSDAKKMVLLK